MKELWNERAELGEYDANCLAYVDALELRERIYREALERALLYIKADLTPSIANSRSHLGVIIALEQALNTEVK